ncbi:hypothetical protein KM043_010901 [Ampulex compressa]|nr:hypothetical protein KM043_010901 [Ampulex compressa]
MTAERCELRHRLGRRIAVFGGGGRKEGGLGGVLSLVRPGERRSRARGGVKKVAKKGPEGESSARYVGCDALERRYAPASILARVVEEFREWAKMRWKFCYAYQVLRMVPTRFRANMSAKFGPGNKRARPSGKGGIGEGWESLLLGHKTSSLRNLQRGDAKKYSDCDVIAGPRRCFIRGKCKSCRAGARPGCRTGEAQV